MNKYYRKVPPVKVVQFMRFRRDHPLKTLVINGITWEYLTSDDPTGKALLLLPGALSTAESAWRTFTLLEQKKYHLVCPNYPAEIDNMSGLADGITAILTQESIQETYVVGGSYGGMVAQVFTHRHPELVTRLVLSHTYPPEGNRARNVQPALRMFKMFPMFLVKKMLRDRMTGILPPRPSPELSLVAAQIRETVDTRLTRQAAVNTFLRMMDFDQQTFTPSDLAVWQGKTLIMLAEDDPTTPEALRKALVELYPGARLHLFKGSGHATSILESEEYIKVMERFFEEQG
jgi:pimeloyl-ACP methyl ester carboxylesterase